MGAHVRWKIKRLLAVVSHGSLWRNVRPGETTARKVGFTIIKR